MLGRVFFGKNGGRVASGVAAEKFFFYKNFSPFVSRTHVSRGKWRVISHVHAARDLSVIDLMRLKKYKKNYYRTPSFRQAPECPLLFHHNGRVAGALKGLSVIKFFNFIILATFIRVTRTSEKIFLEIFSNIKKNYFFL
jgi:hypothetical protein